MNSENEISKELTKIKKLDKEAVSIDFYLNTSKYPELSQFKNISWMYNGDKPDTLKLKLMSKIRWNDFELKKTDNSMYSYLLIGTHKKHSFEMPITPAFSGDELELVNELITAKIKKNEDAYAKLKTQYEREVAISRFGTRNWDRCVKDERIMVSTSLVHEEDIDYFYVINYNRNYRIVNRYYLNESYRIPFLKKGNAGIIAFLKTEGEVAYWSGSINEEIVSIGLTTYGTKITKPSDLQKLVDRM